MAWSGGTFSRLNGATGWATDESNAIGIESGRHDDHDNELAEGIDNCLTKDGSNSPSSHLTWWKSMLWGGTSGGTAQAQTVSMSPAPAAYAAGMVVAFRAGNTNTAAAPTLNVNSLGAKTLKRANGTAIRAGDIVQNGIYHAVYDGTDFLVLNPTPSWQSWTPSVTGSGSMTVSSLSLVEHLYNVGLDGTVRFEATATFTLGGSASDSVLISLPTALTPIANPHNASCRFICSGIDGGGSLISGGARWRVRSNGTEMFFVNPNGNFTLGAGAGYSIQGSFRL